MSFKNVQLVYLESHFGSYPTGDLVDDLGVKAATVVHVSHHDWKKLKKKAVQSYHSHIKNR